MSGRVLTPAEVADVRDRWPHEPEVWDLATTALQAAQAEARSSALLKGLGHTYEMLEGEYGHRPATCLECDTVRALLNETRPQDAAAPARAESGPTRAQQIETLLHEVYTWADEWEPAALFAGDPNWMMRVERAMGAPPEDANSVRAIEIDRDELVASRDAALRWIGVIGEEFVRAGYPAGDRDVQLANVRRALLQLTGQGPTGAAGEGPEDHRGMPLIEVLTDLQDGVRNGDYASEDEEKRIGFLDALDYGLRDVIVFLETGSAAFGEAAPIAREKEPERATDQCLWCSARPNGFGPSGLYCAVCGPRKGPPNG